MSRLSWTVALSTLMALWIVPVHAELLPGARVIAAQADDDLPDGELDLPDGDLDEPEPLPEPSDAPVDDEGSAVDDEGEADAPLVDEDAGDDIAPTPDERQPVGGDIVNEPADDDAARAGDDQGGDGAETVDAVIDSPWDEDQAEGRRPVGDGETVHEIEVGGGRLDEDGDEGDSLVDDPLFWGGVGGGALLLAGAGVGAGFLIYSLVNGDTGSVAVTLE